MCAASLEGAPELRSAERCATVRLQYWTLTAVSPRYLPQWPVTLHRAVELSVAHAVDCDAWVASSFSCAFGNEPKVTAGRPGCRASCSCR